MSSPAASGGCFRCAAPLPVDVRIGRRDTCSACGADLHVCLNCDFHSPGAHNDCREPNADRVIDKDRSNFCEYFAVVPRVVPAHGAASGTSARQALDALFRKS